MRNPGPTKLDRHNYSRDNLPSIWSKDEAWRSPESPITGRAEDKVKGLHPDILILLWRESKGVE